MQAPDRDSPLYADYPDADERRFLYGEGIVLLAVPAALVAWVLLYLLARQLWELVP